MGRMPESGIEQEPFRPGVPYQPFTPDDITGIVPPGGDDDDEKPEKPPIFN